RLFAQIDKSNRAAIWRGVLAERHGNNQRAREIGGAQKNLCRLMRQGPTLPIGLAIARNGLGRIWHARTRSRENANQGPTNYNPDKLRQNATIFAAYARKHGRDDLALSALSDAKTLENSLFSNGFDDMLLGISITRILNPMFMLQCI